MKFVSDSEQVFPHATLRHRPDSKPIDCEDGALHSTGLKSGNNTMHDNQNGVLCASEANERDTDGWTATKLDRSMSLNDLTNTNEKDVKDLMEPISRSCPETKSFEDSGFYMDKNVMECELPELIVCYKDSTYPVKDICIDEGVWSQDKNILKGDVDENVVVCSQDKNILKSHVDEEGVCILLPPENDINSELIEQKNETDKLLPDVIKSSAENVSRMDTVYKYDSSQRTCPEKMVSLAELLAIQGSVSKNSHLESSTKNDTEVEKASFECSDEKEVSGILDSAAGESNDGTDKAIAAHSDLVSASEESNGGNLVAILAQPALSPAVEEKQNDSEGGTLASSDLVSASEESTKSNIVEKPSYNSKVETGSITFDFDACASKEKAAEDCPHHGESAASIDQNPDIYKLEDAPRLSISSQALGESSFSIPGSLPSLITYSGPVAFSGNLSIRSDSSTTSTRSFAFPVLQSEWNSSPVRMAKADRRRLRKSKCWTQKFICCRF